MPSTPPASTWMPASRAGCAAAMTSRGELAGDRAAVHVQQHLRDGGPPSSLSSRSSAPRAYGLVTLVTCGAASMRRTDS